MSNVHWMMFGPSKSRPSLKFIPSHSFPACAFRFASAMFARLSQASRTSKTLTAFEKRSAMTDFTQKMSGKLEFDL